MRDSKKHLTTSTSGNSGMTDSNSKKIKNTKKIMKKQFVNRVFSSVSMKYDFMNDLMSFGMHRIWKEKVISLLEISQRLFSSRPCIRFWRYFNENKRKI